MKDLEKCRQEIDEIDQEIIALFEKRMNVAKDVVTYKLANDLEIFQPEREQQVIQKNVNRMENKDLKQYAHLFVQDMMNISKSYQATFMAKENAYDLKEPQRKDAIVGFQGVLGSFSNQALDAFFNTKTKRKNYEHFEDVFEALKNKEIQYGIVPLENSSTGAINDNYDLIRDYGFFIVGEQSLSISQSLLGLPQAKIEDLKKVYSHPQGLLQTSEFLHEHPYIQGIEYANTAAAAKYVSETQDPTLAAIASSDAAKLYGLEVLKENIQDYKNNETRFIIFSDHLENEKDASRVSVVFTLNHEVGSLYQVMKIVKDHNLNMLRIESRPILKTPWEYYFYMDLEGNLEEQNMVLALEDLKAHTNILTILGNYKKQ